jgi:cell division protein YceG involved in septum cleavage
LSRGDRSQSARERTAEERERDREERERRRGRKSGHPSSAEPAVDSAEHEPGTQPAIDSAARASSAEPTVDSVEHAPPAEQMPAAESPLPAPPLPPPAPPLPSAQPPAPAAPRNGRSPIARLGAVIALAMVIAAVVLLVRSLGASHPKPIVPAPVVKVVIPEGKTRAQIAQIATAARLSGSYRVASRRSPLLDPVQFGAPRGTPDLEGFLFPATYDMNPGEPASRLVEEQLLAFRENFGPSDIARARALHLTPYQLLIVASMVEREAQLPRDRPKIAAVIYNRLQRGMPLGIDATIYYAVELRTGIATYTHELTEAQLQIDSPYNTRTHTGLPPTPISNPGVASIQAAAHPAHVPYLYYVAGADGCGEQVFSSTQAEFEVNAAAYRTALARNRGRPPTCKRK